MSAFMTTKLLQTETDKAVAAEKIKAFFKDSNDQNLAGAVVFTLIIWVVVEYVPTWAWLSGLLIVYAATGARAYLIRQYGRDSTSKSPEQWEAGQVFFVSVAGIGWGFTNTIMSTYVSVPFQVFIAAVTSVAAAASTLEGFSYPAPSRAFIVTSLAPLTIWFYTVHDRLHLILGVMLTVFITVILWQATKHHYSFIDSLKLRFDNEILANKLAEQYKIAEEAGWAKARFLAAASHDLRQPIQALMIFQELIRPEIILTEKGEHYFSRSQQAVKSISNLLNSLLDISKLDSNTVKCEPQVVILENLLDEIRSEFMPLAKQKGIRLRIVKTSICLETDPWLLGQILRNLISNALRYTHTGKVLVGCRRRQNRLAIAIWDTGIGIQEKYLRAIFGEFFQVDNKERDRQRGLGLGLAIVDRAAKLLNATVTVSSELGHGSCFTISLPLGNEITKNSINPIEKSALSNFDLQDRLVVVIENETLIRKGIHSLLENWGCKVISGESEDDVREQIHHQNKTIDMVISDFGLAGSNNGIDVIQNLRIHFGSDIPALLITGDTSQHAIQEANKANLKTLHKPIQPWLLQQTLTGLFKPI